MPHPLTAGPAQSTRSRGRSTPHGPVDFSPPRRSRQPSPIKGGVSDQVIRLSRGYDECHDTLDTRYCEWRLLMVFQSILGLVHLCERD